MFVQAATGVWSTGSSWSTGSFTVTAGNDVTVAAYLAAGNSSNTISGVTDSLGNTYDEVDRIEDVTFGGRWMLVIFHSKITVGGSCIVTAASGASIDKAKITAHEYSGRDATTPVNQHTIREDSSAPGSGAELITSGPVTATAGDDIFGATINNNGGDTFAHGTGFTDGVMAAGLATEYIENSAGGSVDAKFTATFGTDIYMTAIMALKASAGAVVPKPGNLLMMWQ